MTGMLADHGRAIVRAWAGELAAALGRPEHEIAVHGLDAGDFRAQLVELEFDDGSRAELRYAFAVTSATKRAIAVFTEHCGYFVVPAGTRVVVRPH
jgi:hypothetical protein